MEGCSADVDGCDDDADWCIANIAWYNADVDWCNADIDCFRNGPCFRNADCKKTYYDNSCVMNLQHEIQVRVPDAMVGFVLLAEGGTS